MVVAGPGGVSWWVSEWACAWAPGPPLTGRGRHRFLVVGREHHTGTDHRLAARSGGGPPYHPTGRG